MRLGVRAALSGGVLVPGDVEVADGRVLGVGLGAGTGGRIAAPGFVDLQVNGFAGVDLLAADARGYAEAGAALLAHGTTAYHPTFVSAPEAQVLAALAAMPPRPPGPRLLGAHLEGPFLSARHPGVHRVEDLRDPDPALLLRGLAAGRVGRVTLAPELPGALALVDLLRERGIPVAAGHSAATAAEAHAGFDRGVGAVTHLHNAMAPGTPREPGLATAALAREGVGITLIADGHHLAPDTIRLAWRAAAGRLALVTDAVAAAGAGDGVHALAGRPVHSSGGAVRDGDGRLAGSTLTMDAAVRALHGLGAPLEAALLAASEVPARLAGRPELGRLEPGAPADVVVLDDRLEVVGTLVAGAAH